MHTTHWTEERLQQETFGNTALFWKCCEEAEQIIQSTALFQLRQVHEV